MQKVFLIFIICFTGLQNSYGLNGKILRDQIHNSELLNQEVLYNVYLPPGYNEDNEYPVLFYLHWFGGDNNSSESDIGRIDSLISRNKMPAMVVISPNADICWYIDDYQNKFQYSSMFMLEFLPYIQAKFNISNDYKLRAVMGSSMGGFGSLRFAMLYPDQFGICISFMGGMSTKEQIVNDSDSDYKTYHQNLYGDNLKGRDRVNEQFIKNNPLYIAEEADVNMLKRTRWFIQTCDDDYHSLPNAELHTVFHRLGVKHEFRVNDGGHDGDCVMSSLNEALEFLGNAFDQDKK